jgi:hypothetical protein
MMFIAPLKGSGSGLLHCRYFLLSWCFLNTTQTKCKYVRLQTESTVQTFPIDTEEILIAGVDGHMRLPS